MRSRKYVHRIDICQNTYISDGYGGKKLGDATQIGSSWCNVKTLRAERITNLGLADNDVVIEVNLRYRDDINYNNRDIYFRYKGIDFNILRIEPINIEKYEIKITAASNTVKTTIQPVGGFPYNFPITLP